MPDYRWTCQVCQFGNSANVERCEHCGHSAETTAWDVDARIFAFKNMLGGKEQFSCTECGFKLHDVSFSEDPVGYFQSREGRPLLRNMMVFTRCRNCNHKKEKEFFVPILRRLYRKITGKDIERFT
ncbi:hypothetical protein [Thalassotalea fusca]